MLKRLLVLGGGIGGLIVTREVREVSGLVGNIGHEG